MIAEPTIGDKFQYACSPTNLLKSISVVDRHMSSPAVVVDYCMFVAATCLLLYVICRQLFVDSLEFIDFLSSSPAGRCCQLAGSRKIAKQAKS
jgi:hypothetical protein